MAPASCRADLLKWPADQRWELDEGGAHAVTVPSQRSDWRPSSMVPLISLLLVWFAATAHPKLPLSTLILPLLDPGNWLVLFMILLAPFEWLWKRFRGR